MSQAEKDPVPFFEAVKPTSFKWPVKVPVPADGHYVHATFTGVFLYLDEAGVDAWLQTKLVIGTDPKGMPIERARTDRELAAEVLLGVEDLVGPGGAVLPSTPELVAQVLGVDRAPSAVVTTYLAVCRGVAAEKNS